VPESLRALARTKLQRGELPRQVPVTIAAGVGNGNRPCALCTETIDGPVEIRVVLADTTAFYFHGHCHHIWLVEREALWDG
jgi:hypothetical protein